MLHFFLVWFSALNQVSRTRQSSLLCVNCSSSVLPRGNQTRKMFQSITIELNFLTNKVFLQRFFVQSWSLLTTVLKTVLTTMNMLQDVTSLVTLVTITNIRVINFLVPRSATLKKVLRFVFATKTIDGPEQKLFVLLWRVHAWPRRKMERKGDDVTIIRQLLIMDLF